MMLDTVLFNFDTRDPNRPPDLAGTLVVSLLFDTGGCFTAALLLLWKAWLLKGMSLADPANDLQQSRLKI